MGEAKRRRQQNSTPDRVVYHHTSTLRTNLLWMSGVIEVEGRGRDGFTRRLARSGRTSCVGGP
jgi:hypothetical protein